MLLTLPFSLPIIGFAALALWFSGGSPFYTQDRLGAGGKRFSILKLRTMVPNAEQVLEEYLTKDPEMRQEGREQETKGKAQQLQGDVEGALGTDV